MPTIALEGTGSTVSFGTSNFTSDLVNITLPERSREAVDINHLGLTVVKKTKPGKLIDPGQISMEFDFNPAALRLIKQSEEEVTITLPVQEGHSTPATVVFTGYATSEGGEELTIDNRATTKITFQLTTDMDITPGS